MSMSFRQSIYCMLGVSLFVTVLIGGIGGHYMLRNAKRLVYQHDITTKAVVSIEELKSTYWKIHAWLLQMALDKDSGLIDKNYLKVLELQKQGEELMVLYQAPNFCLEERELFAAFKEKRLAYLEVYERALELVRTTTDDQGVSFFNRFSNEELLPTFYDFIEAMDALNTHILRRAERGNADGMESSYHALMSMVAIITATVVCLLAFAYYFSNSILGLARRLTAIATAIAGNDFSKHLDNGLLARKDEFGTMAQALDQMQGKLKQHIVKLNTTAENLAASSEQAQRASEYKTAFLARMSHEIRTPINAIIGMTYIARKARDKAAANDCLDKINTSSAHLLGIINDILDMSKIEAGKFDLLEEEFRMEKLLMDVCTVVSVKTEEKEQKLLVTLRDEFPSRFIGDGLRLAQVLTNILNNASKFTPLKGVIRLEAFCAERDAQRSKICFNIKDTGIGLSEEQISRLFTPFEQADGSTSRQFGGTGLGLAICKRIVGLMGGDIKVESELGKGSCFSICVPLKNSQNIEQNALSDAVDPGSIKMLLVDNSFEIRDFFSRLFGRLNMRLKAAANAEEAGALLAKNGEALFNIIFIDWSTVASGARGDKAAEAFVYELKKYNSRAIIVALVPISRFSAIEELAGRAGVSRFLSKPVFPSSLINLLNELMGPPNAGELSEVEAGADFSGRRVLMAEDVEINREIVFAYLENTGIHIDVAENGAEALGKYLSADGAYDILLMDIHMPLMDGYTATRRIREEELKQGWPRVRIVAMTANAFKEDVERCIAAGMDDHLAKPMSADALVAMLKKYLS